MFILTSVYMVMPVGRLSLQARARRRRHRGAAVGDHRHILVWYFDTLSQVGVVYGSLTTAIMVLLSLEIGATLLLLGAQVISEYERLGKLGNNDRPKPMHTD